MKKMSAGLILTDGDKFLVCHVTGRNHYDIPKGLVDAAEDPVTACIREVEEETGLVIGQERLVDLGVFEYYRGKDLHLFLLVDKALPNTVDMTCRSFFRDKKGKRIPEVDGCKYIGFDSKHLYMTENMVRVIQSVQSKLR